ncbi:hypothetical protein, partial [Klebsiella pneumoniae]|uniref:hypothetical protein n=1 Tax=Klebsiella pneumoniae TaxID=573 RepID=UPI001C643614
WVLTVRKFRFRAHHATAVNIVNPPEFRPDAVFRATIEVFYPAERQRNYSLYYSIVFINLLENYSGNISRKIS